MKRIVCACIAALGFVLLAAGLAAAQSPNTGSIIVTVVDPNGAVVPGAVISVKNEATGSVRDSVSSSEGTAVFTGLSLTGGYSVRVEAKGFAAGTTSNLFLRASETAKVLSLIHI